MADLLFGTPVFTALFGLSSLKHCLLRWISSGKPANARKAGEVSGIYVYPVKSCGGVEVEEARVTHWGIMDVETQVMDRHFMVVDAESKNFISQRTEPTLTLVKPRIEGKVLIIEGPGMEPLSVPTQPAITPDSQVYLCRIWGDPVPGLDCGKEAEAWFSIYLKRPAALVYAEPSLNKRLLHDSHLCRQYDNVAFQDWGQVLCISDASLKELNKRLERPVLMSNFRPNFTIGGCLPHDEDSWNTLYIGDSQFTNIKPCGRCVMTTIDCKHGIKSSDKQPLETLRTYRTKPGFGPCFGINVFCDAEGTIKNGDKIDVVKKNDPSTAWF